MSNLSDSEGQLGCLSSFLLFSLVITGLVYIFKGLVWVCKKTGLWIVFAVFGALVILSDLTSGIDPAATKAASAATPAFTGDLGSYYHAYFLTQQGHVALIILWVLGVSCTLFMLATTARTIVRAARRQPGWNYRWAIRAHRFYVKWRAADDQGKIALERANWQNLAPGNIMFDYRTGQPITGTEAYLASLNRQVTPGRQY